MLTLPVLPSVALSCAVKGNVTFGRAFDEERWQQCVDACCLATDLEVLPAGECNCCCHLPVQLGRPQVLNIA